MINQSKCLIATIMLSFSFMLCGQAQPLAEHVILIGLDGWAAHDFEQAHNITYLMKNGSYTLHKRSVIPSSSGVNWASMFMGASPKVHGYTTWNSKTPDVSSMATNANGIFPTIFSLVRQHYPEAETGCTFEWEGIKYIIDTLSISQVNKFSKNEFNSRIFSNFATKYSGLWKKKSRESIQARSSMRSSSAAS